MGNIYVRSTDGNNADSGATWALAKADASGAAAIDAAGDTVWFSQSHSENGSGTLDLNFAGTLASPVRVLCGNDAAEPPIALATGATITRTGTTNTTISGAVYVYGITIIQEYQLFLNGSSANYPQTYENCSFQMTNSGSAGVTYFGTQSNQGYLMTLKNCTFKFAAAANTLQVIAATAILEGCSFVSGTTSPTVLFGLSQDRSAANLLVTGMDMTNLAAGVKLFSAAAFATFRAVVRNSKLPASWSGTLVDTGIPGPGQRFCMYNCDSGAVNYKLWIEEYSGTIKDETTLVRTGGASDGTTPISWKMTTAANANFLQPLPTDEIVIWNETTGSAKTLTVEILHDSATALKDDEVWVEVTYLGSASTPIATIITDKKADTLATAADQASSSVTWTTTGMGNPNKQKLSVTFTPQMKGFIHAVVKAAKASKTLYVDPKLTIS